MKRSASELGLTGPEKCVLPSHNVWEYYFFQTSRQPICVRNNLKQAQPYIIKVFKPGSHGSIKQKAKQRNKVKPAIDIRIVMLLILYLGS